jgi:hypothetical protein
MFQIMDDYAHDRPVFGRECTRLPFVFISTIAGEDECNQMARKLGSTDIPVLSVFGQKEKLNFENVVNLALRHISGLGVIFLDGVHRLSMGNMNDPCVASDSMSEIYRNLRDSNLTLVASGCSSKPKEQYSTGMDRFAGAFSWMQSSSCYVFVDYVNSKKSKREAHKREITLHPKDGRPETALYYFCDSGRLEPYNATALDTFRYRNFDEQLRESGSDGEMIPMKDIYELGELNDMPASTVDTRVADLVDHGTLERVMHGRYRVRQPS